jgi:uncharacterized membrane protein
LGEALSEIRMVGILIICLGVFLIARN